MSNILESITDGVVIYDREWRITFINQPGAQMFGETPENLIGNIQEDIGTESANIPFYREFRRAIVEQVSVHFQEFYAPLQIWFEVHAYPSPEGLIVLYHDMTQRKQAEEVLKKAYGELEYRVLARTLELSRTSSLLQSQTVARQRAEEALKTTNEQLAKILNSIKDGFCAVDREWRYVYVNQKAEQILRKNQSELLGKNMWELFPESRNSAAYYHYHEAVKTGVPVRFEVFDAAINRWFETNVYPSPQGLAIYFQDISDRKQLEEERNQLLLREQEARIAAERANQRCAFLAQASEVLASSLKYETTLKSVAELIVPLLADYCLIHKLDSNGQLWKVAVVHQDNCKQGLVEELSRCYQTHIHNPNNLMAQVLRTGEPIMISEVSTPIDPAVTEDPKFLELYAQLQPKSLVILPLTARKQILGTLVLAMAESDRRYDESDLLLALDLARRAATAIDNVELYHKAQESNRLKDEFLLTLSHELRTPLNTILGWANMLRTRRLNEKIMRQALETIERKAKAQVQIVYDLLDVSRLLTGRLRLNPGWVELGAIVQEAIATLQIAIQAKSIQLVSHIDNSVGLVQGDSKYLHQVIWHLLSNAIKFTPHGGQVVIEVTSIVQGVQIQVSDTGLGIDPEFLPYIFDRFRQADGAMTRRFGGLGLGLSLVRQLVELHGGTVQVSSEGEGQGATFTIQLPMTPVINSFKLHPELAEIDERLSSHRSFVLEGLRLLVVDDEPDSREAIVSMLSEYGADVIAVTSVSEALEVVLRLKPDLLIRNNHMLESDAYWLLSRIRSFPDHQGGQIPMIALHPDVQNEIVKPMRSAGIQMYIPCPIPSVELADLIAALARQN
jgi:PAS domain S-box-containing protein